MGLCRNSPKKRPKGHTGLCRLTELVTPTMRYANFHGPRDEAGEPENRRYYIHAQDGELMTDMLSLRIVAWGDYKEGDGEDGPDGAEDHEVKLARGCVGEDAVDCVRDYVDADVSH